MQSRLYLLPLILVTSLFASACHILPDPVEPVKVTGQGQDVIIGCENTLRSKGPAHTARYNTPVWSDEFNGPTSKDDPSCFTMAPMCSHRLDWFGAEGPCRDATNPGLRKLNKCNWTLWEDYSFWGNENMLAYKPNQVSVEMVSPTNGELVLRARRRTDLTSYKCGPSSRDPNSANYNDMDCEYESGGLDTAKRGNGKTGGPAMSYGRLEMQARLAQGPGAYPTFWLWPDGAYSDHDLGGITKEIDVLEAPYDGTNDTFTSTVHNWVNGLNISKGFRAHSRPLTDSHIYGVEWDDTEVRFYEGDCWIGTVKKGDEGWDNGPKSMDMFKPTLFAMMSLGVNKTSVPPSASNFQNLEYRIDYVRFFQ